MFGKNKDHEQAAANTPNAGKSEEPAFFSYENLRSLGTLIIIILALRWSVASPYYVPTASMEPTIKVGDRLLANKLAYDLRIPFTDMVIANWGTVKRGDVVVFRYPKDPDIDYVKRVVAVEGDRIRLVDDVIYINDEPQERINFNHDRSILSDIHDNKDMKLLFKEKLAGVEHWTINNIANYRHFSSGTWPEEGYITVPKGSVYCIGDNRDNSSDSRVWGKVQLSYIRGKALFVIWSAYFPDGNNWPHFRFDRIGHWLDGDLSKSSS